MTTKNKKNTPDKEMSLVKSVANENDKVNMDIDKWLINREAFLEKVSSKMKEGKDYHIIQNKKSLAKGGAEKIASIYQWSAQFIKDEDVISAFQMTGLIAFICNLLKDGQIVGQGRGASTLGKNSGDPNKTIKMAQKSAFIDAVIRASGLSDIFTQDLEDMNPADIGDYKSPASNDAMTHRQEKFMKDLMKEKGVSKLGDMGIDQPAMITRQWATDVIEALLALQPKTDQQEFDQQDNHIESININDDEISQ